MTARFLGRRILALIVALGMSFSTVAPALAVPAGDNNVMAGMTMPGMDGGCMEAAQKSMPAKQLPGKSNRGSCSLCISCAVNIDLGSALIAAPFLWHRGDRLTGTDARPDGVAIPPALPPPIHSA